MRKEREKYFFLWKRERDEKYDSNFVRAGDDLFRKTTTPQKRWHSNDDDRQSDSSLIVNVLRTTFLELKILSYIQIWDSLERERERERERFFDQISSQAFHSYTQWPVLIIHWFLVFLRERERFSKDRKNVKSRFFFILRRKCYSTESLQVVRFVWLL